MPDAELRSRLVSLVAAQACPAAPQSGVDHPPAPHRRHCPVRSLLVAVSGLAWQATGEHPAIDALTGCALPVRCRHQEPAGEVTAARLGSAWRQAIADVDRERAFRHWRWLPRLPWCRALRNGSVWIEHSLSFRGRERLFIPDERWKTEARRHYARLQLPAKASDFPHRCLYAFALVSMQSGCHASDRCAWMTSCTWHHWPPMKKIPKSPNCAAGLTSASARCN